uniref:Uncharacterized protein n=1 Tax=Virus sp. ctAgr11 TaxID=2825800 RepID=A0A8S5RJ64_9VIRU|nr:MAG TPA: hypothetical protein [Virus sp. ctAgr11]
MFRLACGNIVSDFCCRQQAACYHRIVFYPTP